MNRIYGCPRFERRSYAAAFASFEKFSFALELNIDGLDGSTKIIERLPEEANHRYTSAIRKLNTYIHENKASIHTAGLELKREI